MSPLINDVTTTPENPPVFSVLKNENPQKDWIYPSKNISIQKATYPDLKPYHSLRSAQDLFKNVEKSAKNMHGWSLVSVDSQNLKIEAIATTPLLRFRDDVVIEVRAESTGSSVHVRSKSRIGKGDLGANAKRIRKFFSELNYALSK